MIFVLTGDGKGKTTCAIGMGIRATGAGRNVLMVRFLKPNNSSSEDKVIDKIKKFELMSFGKKGFKIFPKRDSVMAQKGFEIAEQGIVKKNSNFLILDEINLVLYFKLIDKKIVLDFLEKYGKKIDIVLTGRYCPAEIMEKADLITEFKEKKHYYQKGVKARKGIEY